MLLRTLRQFAAAVSKDLGNRYGDQIRSNPGQIFFPKRFHELGSLESDAPDGLSFEYLQIAAAKNEIASRAETVDTPVTILAAQVSGEITRAVLLERQIALRIER